MILKNEEVQGCSKNFLWITEPAWHVLQLLWLELRYEYCRIAREECFVYKPVQGLYSSKREKDIWIASLKLLNRRYKAGEVVCRKFLEFSDPTLMLVAAPSYCDFKCV